MTYKERYMLENEKAIKRANRRAKIANTVACILILFNMMLIMVGVSAIDYNPVKSTCMIAGAVSAIIFVLAVCKLIGLDVFEVDSDESV